MGTKFKELWVEKYRPKKLKDYIFDNDHHRVAFKSFIRDKSIPHLLLSGVQGSGKTSIAQILINEINVDPADTLIINASDENSVDVMRDKIKTFVSSYGFGSTGFKVVVLEEGDYISHSGQQVLLRLMEDYADDSRFIITANNENKLKPSLKSRCQHFKFKASDKDDIAEFVAKILVSENIDFDLDELDDYIRIDYPDIRKIINTIQSSISNNSLMNVTNTESSSDDYNISLLDHIAKDDWNSARKVVCGNVSNDEIESIFRFLYMNLDKSKKFSNSDKWEAGQIEIAQHLYMHSLVADPEINLSALFIKLKQI